MSQDAKVGLGLVALCPSVSYGDTALRPQTYSHTALQSYL